MLQETLKKHFSVYLDADGNLISEFSAVLQLIKLPTYEEYCELVTDDFLRLEYHMFLKSPLTLGMFMPVTKDHFQRNVFTVDREKQNYVYWKQQAPGHVTTIGCLFYGWGNFIVGNLVQSRNHKVSREEPKVKHLSGDINFARLSSVVTLDNWDKNLPSKVDKPTIQDLLNATDLLIQIQD